MSNENPQEGYEDDVTPHLEDEGQVTSSQLPRGSRPNLLEFACMPRERSELRLDIPGDKPVWGGFSGSDDQR